MATQLLLADDSATIAKILLMALQSEPYEIRSVLTAEEALTELKKNPPFFFLCDLNLPGKSGYEFARLIRRDSKLREVRVVLLASAFEPVDEAEYANCGADALVKKPFDPAELRAKLRNIHDAPPKFPDGAHVTGSLSGFMVSDPHDSTKTNLTVGGLSTSGSVTDTNPDILQGVALPEADADPLAGLLERPGIGAGPANENDADAILAGLLAGNAPEQDEAPPPAPAKPAQDVPRLPPAAAPSPEAPPPFAKPAAPSGTEFRPDRTIALDLDGGAASDDGGDTLDLSDSFNTPAGGTIPIELGTHTVNFAPEDEAPPPAPPAAAAPASEPLSANAQALAAFFEAEITSHTEAPPAEEPAPSPTLPERTEPSDAFDASLDSIDWTSGPGEASLNQWSSPAASKPAAPERRASADAPPPFSAEGRTSPGVAPAPAASAGPGAKPGARREAPVGNLMFDTGGSSFRFSEDYIARITKSFTGAPEEHVPESQAPMFHQSSDDRGPAANAPEPIAPMAAPAAEAPQPASGFGGGAWSEGDVQKIEQIVREEVQMVVREVAEKIAWEVIPELAENLIRKELEKVLKEMGQ